MAVQGTAAAVRDRGEREHVMSHRYPSICFPSESWYHDTGGLRWGGRCSGLLCLPLAGSSSGDLGEEVILKKQAAVSTISGIVFTFQG